MKVYSADEGRCQITAAAFTKGLLKVNDDITPIMSSFVISDQKAIDLLDYSKKNLGKYQEGFIIEKSSPTLINSFLKKEPI